MGQMPDKMRIQRGPGLEAWVMRPRSARPDLIIRFGHSLDYSLGSFSEAEQFARRILALGQAERALQAVQEMLDGRRDDFDRVCDLVDEAVARLDPVRALPPPRFRRLIFSLGNTSH